MVRGEDHRRRILERREVGEAVGAEDLRIGDQPGGEPDRALGDDVRIELASGRRAHSVS